MNKKIALILPIIITTPFLMANSPAPGPTTMSYGRFKASVVLLENREDSFYYELQINNVGDKYIPIYTLSCFSLSLDDINDNLFVRECIPPGINKTYHFITSKKITADKWTSISAATFADEDDSIVFEDAKLEKVEDKERTYIMSAEISGEWDYYDNTAIVEIEYQGNIYAFEWSKRTEYIEIKGEELNLDEVVIKK